MDDSSPLLNFLPSSKIPLACSILHAFVLLLISNPSLPHSAYFDTHRCALFTVQFCIDTLSSVIIQFEARLTLAASAALPILLFPLLLFLNSLLSSSLLPHPTPIFSSSILNPNPPLKTKTSSPCPFTYTTKVLRQAVPVIHLQQHAIFLLSQQHSHRQRTDLLPPPPLASGNVSSIAQDVEGDREEKQSRQFQPKFAQMPLICRVRPKTDSTNGGSVNSPR
ncbi:hypothetical protein BLNAU_5287 [Blattamonas nauphoetae]|uniref:Uncharacterized protein n=1 Tax=Blattamonas nauphoetae TaxID=2049346 RepID=A0ABQ9Y7X8_9EUKA|nr:hypothetical protein BLNAU_5287 [Blattamonas nauphoetae]